MGISLILIFSVNDVTLSANSDINSFTSSAVDSGTKRHFIACRPFYTMHSGDLSFLVNFSVLNVKTVPDVHKLLSVNASISNRVKISSHDSTVNQLH